MASISNFLFFVTALVVTYYIYSWYKYKVNGELKFQGLKYTWDNPGSEANPPDRSYIKGHRWTKINNIKQVSKNNIKKENSVYINNFRFFNKYIKETEMPFFIKNKFEKTEFYLNSDNFCRGVLAIGGAGSGKTEWLLNIMNQFHFYDKSITFEKKGDFSKLLYRPGIDILINPKMKLGVIHNILDEDIQYIKIYIDTIMNATLGKNQDYFSGSAKQKLEKFLQKVKIKSKDEELSIVEKWDFFITLFEEAFEDAQNGDQKSERDVMSTTKATMDSLYLLAYRIRNGARTFSVKEFFENKNSCRIFLNATDLSLDALLAATTAVLIKYQLALSNHWCTKVVPYFLDEYLSLDRVIDKTLTTEMVEVGRSKMFATFRFIQNMPEKEEDKKRLISNMQYLVTFSGTDISTLEDISKLVGDVEYEYHKKNESYSNQGKSVSYSVDKVKERLLNTHMLNIIQKEGFSHVFFAPKEEILFKGYTPQVYMRERKYLDFSEIDLNELYRWKIEREDSIKKKSKITENALNDIIKSFDE